MEEYPALAERPTFKEFVALYIAEGSKRERSKRERSQVKICNSDADVMTLSVHWLRVLAERTLRFSIQYHVDQDVEELRTFWGTLLGFPPEDLRLQRKSNSGKLAGRQWRSRHGVLSVRVSDTMPRARLQAWIDLTKACWQ